MSVLSVRNLECTLYSTSYSVTYYSEGLICISVELTIELIVVFAGSTAPSLLDEGLRISRQYGLGPEFEEELQALKNEKLQDADDEDVQTDWAARSSAENESDKLRLTTS